MSYGGQVVARAPRNDEARFFIHFSNSERMHACILAASDARALQGLPPSWNEEGAEKAGCTLHPRSRVQVCAKNAHTSIQVQRRQSGFPCATALRLTSCSPR